MTYDQRSLLLNIWTALMGVSAGADLDCEYAKELADGLKRLRDSLPPLETEAIKLKGGHRDGMILEGIPADRDSISVAYVEGYLAVRVSPLDPKPELEIKTELYNRTRECDGEYPIFLAPSFKQLAQ